MDREIKEIKVYHDGFNEDVSCWIIPSEDDPEDFDLNLLCHEMLDIPGWGFFFIYYYDGQISHFFTEGISVKNYLINIDDPRYTPVEGTFDYHGDGLDLVDQSAYVIIREVLKKRGYLTGKDLEEKMENYTLEDFREDIRSTREFEFSYKDKFYSLSYSKEGFVFTDVDGEIYAIYDSYEDLLKSIRIEDMTIEEIISENLYEDLSIY